MKLTEYDRYPKKAREYNDQNAVDVITKINLLIRMENVYNNDNSSY